MSSHPPPPIAPDTVRIRDPLSEVTRKERRSLLGVSILGVAVAQAGLLPTEITTLGVKLGSASQSALLVLLGLICCYYLVAFLVYATADYIAWKIALRDAISNIWTRPREKVEVIETEEDALRQIRREESLEEFIQTRNSTILLAEVALVPASRVRAVFEFVLPALVGSYATVVLFLRSAA